MGKLGRFIDSFGIGLILLFLCFIFYTQSDLFFTTNNFTNILIQTSVNIIIATGMTFVISAAEIDLSVGSLLALCGMVTAFILKVDPETGLNLPLSVMNSIAGPMNENWLSPLLWRFMTALIFLFFAMLPGILSGGLVGLIVVGLGVPSFIVTLGFMLIDRGLARYLTNAAPVTGLPIEFMTIGSGVWFELWGFRITYSSMIALTIVVIGILLLSRCRFGRHVLAVGGNAQAAYLSGVPVKWNRFLVFVVSGACVSIAAIVQTSRLFMGDPNAGEGYELDAIAAVIIGGTSLFGGKGTVLGTLFGALIIGVLRNGLDLMEVTDHIKLIVIGFMIVFAVFLDYFRRQFSRGS